MKKVAVGIIGGTGGMGRWFADLCREEGCTVYVIGRNTTIRLNDAARLSDVIVVSVPISVTAEVISQVGPLLTEEKLMMDLTSLKTKPVKMMLDCTRAEVVGCHPLFGPLLTETKGQNIVLCAARGNKWFTWLKTIFKDKGFTVVEASPESHDKMMALVQALNHLNTIALGMALADEGTPIAEVNRYSTPIFRTKMEIMKKVFDEKPELYADIIAGNPDAFRILDIYEKTLSKISSLLRRKDGGMQLRMEMEKTSKKLFRR